MSRPGFRAQSRKHLTSLAARAQDFLLPSSAKPETELTRFLDAYKQLTLLSGQIFARFAQVLSELNFPTQLDITVLRETYEEAKLEKLELNHSYRMILLALGEQRRGERTGESIELLAREAQQRLERTRKALSKLSQASAGFHLLNQLEAPARAN